MPTRSERRQVLAVLAFILFVLAGVVWLLVGIIRVCLRLYPTW